MTARLYLTVYADDDLPTEEAHIASKSLGTVTACSELSFTKHHHGTDALKLKINRHHPQAALLLADRYVIVHSDLGPIGGSFLEEAPIDLSAAEGKGDEWMEWSGRGPMSILERGIMDNHSGIGDDPIDGFWDLSNQGDFAGASNGHPIPMMKRVMNEIDTNSPNALAIVDHSSWDYDEDTDAVEPPFLGSIVYGANVGDDALSLAADMSQLGGVTWVMSYLFKMDAHISYGTDRTGAFGASGKVRFQKGVNIADSIQRKVRGSVLRTHLIVGGADRTYITVTDPDYVSGDVVRWGFLSMPETSNTETLENAGLAHIEARKKQTDVWSFPQHDHGDDITKGVYEPGPPGTTGAHYWVGDTVTLHSGTGPYDANALAVPLSAITWQLKTGDEANGDYWVIPQVGATFNWPAAGPHHIPPAPPSVIACEDLTASQLSSRTATNGDFETGLTNWAGTGLTISTAMFHGGSQGGRINGVGSVDVTYDFGSQSFEQGTRYVIDVWRRMTVDHDATTITFGDDGGDEDSKTYTGVVGNDDPDLWDETDTGADGETWQRGRVCWTPSATRTNVRVRIQASSHGTSDFAFDDLALYTAPAFATTQPVGNDGDGSVGTPGVYAPITHIHEHGKLSPSETHHHGTAQIEGYAAGVTDHGASTGLDDNDHPQYWIHAGGGQVPIEVVMAAGSAETVDISSNPAWDVTLDQATCAFDFDGFVVGVRCYGHLHLRQDGTGGRLATWDAAVQWIGGSPPTLQTAANAWDDIAFYSDDGGTTIYAQHTGTSSGSASATPPSILLASDHSTPFTFDDILQASDGSDFLYASE